MQLLILSSMLASSQLLLCGPTCDLFCSSVLSRIQTSARDTASATLAGSTKLHVRYQEAALRKGSRRMARAAAAAPRSRGA